MLLYRRRNGELEVLLVHPGGPYWARKDLGAWSIPKGEVQGDETPLDAARREFREETGVAVEGEVLPLGSVKLSSGKVVHAWAARGEVDVRQIRSNRVALEWPPRSGVMRQFPEVDRAAWFSVPEARRRIMSGQAPFLDRLLDVLLRPDAAP